MSAPTLCLRVYDEGKLTFSIEVSGPVELGRQQVGEQDLFHGNEAGRGSGPSRVIVARFDDKSVSRRHARLDPIGSNRLKLTNLSAGLPVGLGDGKKLAARTSVEIALPSRIAVGGKVIQLEGGAGAMPQPAGLEAPTIVPGQVVLDTGPVRRMAVSSGPDVVMEWILPGLQTAIGLLQSASTGDDFFTLAARATAEIARLDSGSVWMREGEGWRVRASFPADAQRSDVVWRPSRHVLRGVLKERRTLWFAPRAEPTPGAQEAPAVVASPILDREGLVIGALYGDRRSRSPIGEIEATLVEMLARGVAAGLARLGQERAALAARIMFEQFFTPELARQLEIKPDLMKGRDLEVTVLSVHVPGFGRFCERLGPARTAEWVRDMLDTFSQCVLDQHGVVVDLAGHELMALWGAPQEQADQAELACRAAQSVLASLPELNARWKDAVGEAIDAAIGVDTGVARVGHIGSTRRFKYGPLGDTVFVARRVQEATRYLKCHLIVTGPTRARLSPEFQARHLCTARIAGVANPVPLWQLGAAGQDEFQAIRERYERSLEAFEGGHFQDAIRILGEVLSERPDDGPSQLLMSRALGGIVQAREPFQTLWELPNS